MSDDGSILFAGITSLSQHFADRALFALNATTLRTIWSADIGQVPVPLLSSGSALFVVPLTGDADVIHALNGSTGAALWSTRVNASGAAITGMAMSPSGDWLVVLAPPCVVAALNVSDGALRWLSDGCPGLPPRGARGPAVRADGVIYAAGGSDLSFVYATSLDGAPLWRTDLSGSTTATGFSCTASSLAAALPSWQASGTSNVSIMSLSPMSGAELQRVAAYGAATEVSAPAMDAGGMLYVSLMDYEAQRGCVAAVDTLTNERLWLWCPDDATVRFSARRRVTIGANGTVFVSCGHSNVGKATIYALTATS